MVKEGSYYKLGTKVRLICLVVGTTVIYQEVDRNHNPVGERKQATINEFSGWTKEPSHAKRLDRQPGV